MGCANSKQINSAVVADVYRPPASSIALFDINTVDEPWLITTTTAAADDEETQQIKDYNKPSHVPFPLLEKLETYELAPPHYSWSDVSKALQDLKPTLGQEKPVAAVKAKKEQPPPPSPQPASRAAELTGLHPVKENSFLIRDRLERQNGGNKLNEEALMKWKRRRDPLEGYAERAPPGNADGVVLYTTTVRAVRRTFEDCEWARRIVELNAVEAGVAVDERDVSLHGEFLKEVRELVGAGGEGEGAVALPRLFIMGRYIGGVDEMMEVNESGKLREMMRWAKRMGGGGAGGMGCEGCGGARFVPCFECSGSCKVVAEDGVEVVRCGKCNENGLMLCPLCH